MSFVEEQISEQHIFTIKAYENTWSHQRRKNRLKKQEQVEKGDKEDETVSSKKLKLENEHPQDVSLKSLLVECLISLKQENEIIVLEMSWLSGSKESVHQIFQFIKNNWSKVTEINDSEERT